MAPAPGTDEHHARLITRCRAVARPAPAVDGKHLLCVSVSTGLARRPDRGLLEHDRLYTLAALRPPSLPIHMSCRVIARWSGRKRGVIMENGMDEGILQAARVI